MACGGPREPAAPAPVLTHRNGRAEHPARAHEQDDDRLLMTARMTQAAHTLVRLRRAEKVLLQRLVSELAA